jgi:hypothetical protein
MSRCLLLGGDLYPAKLVVIKAQETVDNKRLFTFADNYQVSPSTITFYTCANASLLDRKFPERRIIKRTLTSTTSFDPTARLHLVRKRCLERPVNRWTKKALTNTVRSESVPSMPTLLTQLDPEEVFDNVNPARQTVHLSNKTTD